MPAKLAGWDRQRLRLLLGLLIEQKIIALHGEWLHTRFILLLRFEHCIHNTIHIWLRSFFLRHGHHRQQTRQ